ncbi:MAG: GNAT family N-acetyltransferase [Candidatus Eremiobacteraeota bacterium]|nr:GNAT family N-acetyltransferase [Candidatus Eremiobacteraeota bacterium]
MRLQRVSSARYAREVLPLTAPLWAGSRTLDEYAATTLELARTSYGRRCYATMGLYDGNRLVASHKWYERSLRHDSQALTAVGFGAVFTPEEFRGRGYASVMLASSLDLARDRGHDVAYLFSDIRPQFYADLGFRALASRKLWLEADDLSGDRLRVLVLTDDDWSGVRKCFESARRSVSSSFVRSQAFWEWSATRIRQQSEHSHSQPINLVVKRRGEVCAYVLGARVPQRDAFIFDEFGWTDRAGPTTVAALLRAAAGDLRRATGWLPPPAARELLPRGTVRRRDRAILMMAPLTPAGGRLIDTLRHPARGDFCWATDHI